jgi:hypothetical protein
VKKLLRGNLVAGVEICQKAVEHSAGRDVRDPETIRILNDKAVALFSRC